LPCTYHTFFVETIDISLEKEELMAIETWCKLTRGEKKLPINILILHELLNLEKMNI
jgi:hypothetical protein